MTSTEKRAMDLASKITSAIKAVDTPQRNARAMLTDAAMWSNIAMAIVNVVEGKDAAPEEAVEAEETTEETATEGEEENSTRRRRRRE